MGSTAPFSGWGTVASGSSGLLSESLVSVAAGVEEVVELGEELVGSTAPFSGWGTGASGSSGLSSESLVSGALSGPGALPDAVGLDGEVDVEPPLLSLPPDQTAGPGIGNSLYPP